MDDGSLVTTLILGLALVATILLGVIVLYRNFRDALNQSFFFLTLAAGFWIITNLVFAVVDQSTVQYSAALFSYTAGGLMALSLYRYCLNLGKVKIRPAVHVLSYIIGITISLSAAIPGYIATGVTETDSIVTNTLPLMIYGAYLLLFSAIGIVTLINIRKKAIKAERDRITIVLLGLALSTLVGVSFNLILPIFGNYTLVAYGPVANFIFVATSTYAIIRHQLFDIKLAAVRAVAYAFSILALASIYYFLAYVVSITLFGGDATSEVSLSPINIVIALILAFVFQPIKRFFDRVTDSIFYRDNYKSEDFFATFSTLLTSTVDLRGLLERSSIEIASTLKAEQVFFFLYYSNSTEHHMSAGTHGHPKLPMYDAKMLDAYVMAKKESIFLTNLLTDDNSVRRMLLSHKIALVMPLRRGDKIAGYVLLGDHRSSSYTKRDVNVLLAISNELVIAIQNALSLHELKELNATLQQRIDVATKELRSSNAQLKHLDEVKDEFMSMASHQLRTPLTSVKGYISMVLEGDAGKVSPQQEKLLKEAFSSSERMVGLIADFLNISRLQTGKFIIEKEPTDIKALIKQEITDLKLIADSHDMKLKLTMTDKPLPVNADKAKLQQVVMNFVDNAIYYSSANSTITITVDQVKDNVAFTVTDTGIGVPEDEQNKLFTKFFRAKNARKQRPDGTGVGLYLARRVISAHGGSLIFSSREGKGSTFGFRIPLDKRADSKK